MKRSCVRSARGIPHEFGTIPKYYAFDASAEKMKHNTQEEN